MQERWIGWQDGPRRGSNVEVGGYFGYLLYDDGGPSVVVELEVRDGETVITRVDRRTVITLKDTL